ncbi:MAG: hypothetical protein MHM6MM_002295 [Cercozoa sp. M6MM]
MADGFEFGFGDPKYSDRTIELQAVVTEEHANRLISQNNPSADTALDAEMAMDVGLDEDEDEMPLASSPAMASFPIKITMTAKDGQCTGPGGVTVSAGHVVVSQRIPVNSLVLARASKYFRKMFSGNFSESSERCIFIPLPARQWATFTDILRLIYSQSASAVRSSGRGGLDTDRIIELLMMCDQFDVAGVERFLYEQLTRRNLTFRQLARVVRFPGAMRMQFYESCLSNVKRFLFFAMRDRRRLPTAFFRDMTVLADRLVETLSLPELGQHLYDLTMAGNCPLLLRLWEACYEKWGLAEPVKYERLVMEILLRTSSLLKLCEAMSLGEMPDDEDEEPEILPEQMLPRINRALAAIASIRYAARVPKVARLLVGKQSHDKLLMCILRHAMNRWSDWLPMTAARERPASSAASVPIPVDDDDESGQARREAATSTPAANAESLAPPRAQEEAGDSGGSEESELLQPGSLHEERYLLRRFTIDTLHEISQAASSKGWKRFVKLGILTCIEQLLMEDWERAEPGISARRRKEISDEHEEPDQLDDVMESGLHQRTYDLEAWTESPPENTESSMAGVLDDETDDGTRPPARKRRRRDNGESGLSASASMSSARQVAATAAAAFPVAAAATCGNSSGGDESDARRDEGATQQSGAGGLDLAMTDDDDSDPQHGGLGAAVDGLVDVSDPLMTRFGLRRSEAPRSHWVFEQNAVCLQMLEIVLTGANMCDYVDEFLKQKRFFVDIVAWWLRRLTQPAPSDRQSYHQHHQQQRLQQHAMQQHAMQSQSHSQSLPSRTTSSLLSPLSGPPSPSSVSSGSTLPPNLVFKYPDSPVAVRFAQCLLGIAFRISMKVEEWSPDIYEVRGAFLGSEQQVPAPLRAVAEIFYRPVLGLKVIRCSGPNCRRTEKVIGQVERFKTCSNCFVERYCSRECQVAHWNAGHRDECGKLTE